MYQTMEIFMARKKRVPDRPLPNTYRVFNENVFDVSLDQSALSPPVLFKKPEHPPPHPRSPHRNNMPHPYHARVIRDNVRFLNEPIAYMLTSNSRHKQCSHLTPDARIRNCPEQEKIPITNLCCSEQFLIRTEVSAESTVDKTKKEIQKEKNFLCSIQLLKGTGKAEWWPSHEESRNLHKPSYDRMTTQRSDFMPFTYSSPQTRHGCNPHKSPLHGIVPLATPRGKNRLPKLLQEEISFLHQYDSRLTPNEPIRGKRHGGFVWREIKTESGSAVPQGTGLFLNATGSHALNSYKQKEETQWKAA